MSWQKGTDLRGDSGVYSWPPMIFRRPDEPVEDNTTSDDGARIYDTARYESEQSEGFVCDALEEGADR